MSTAVYLDQIRQLVELQKIDDAIFAVRQDLERAPRELEDLQQRFDASNAQRERVLEKLNHLQEQQKRLDFEIEDDSARIKKSKNKLMQVENQREHHAMMREMDSIEKVIRSREEEKMALMEELQLQNEKLAQIDLTHTGLQAELEVRRDSLEEKLSACRTRLAELEQKREAASSAIPHPVFVRYEFIRKRLEHPVIVAVKEASGNYAQISEIIRNAPEGFSVLSGNDDETLPLMATGASGIISVASNVAPGLMVELAEALLDDNMAKARELHHRLTPLFRNCFVESNPIPAKAALAAMGLISNELRLPLVPAAEKTYALMQKTVADLGL